ncbi:MAG: hypothetical protein C0411_17070 [Pseudomonas sp.]|nr:hypothetical protein [Pseudomonas sp.]
MAIPELFSLASLAIFSLADMRSRMLPAVEIFFLGAVLIAAPLDMLRVSVAVLAVAWGLLRAWPRSLAWPLMLHPSTWVVLLTGFGVRQGVIGRGDLLVIGGLAALLPWPATVLALLGVEAWRRIWRGRQAGPTPALPGMLLGVAVYVVFNLLVA